jgi:hypothetical protein
MSGRFPNPVPTIVTGNGAWPIAGWFSQATTSVQDEVQAGLTSAVCGVTMKVIAVERAVLGVQFRGLGTFEGEECGQ